MAVGEEEEEGKEWGMKLNGAEEGGFDSIEDAEESKLQAIVSILAVKAPLLQLPPPLPVTLPPPLPPPFPSRLPVTMPPPAMVMTWLSSSVVARPRL